LQNKKTIEELRKEIDAVDNQVLALLNERAALVIEVGRLKSAKKGEFHVPSREREIYERLASNNPGPFPNEAIKSVFR
jgi:chorismate mutase/prephenate dehydratase